MCLFCKYLLYFAFLRFGGVEHLKKVVDDLRSECYIKDKSRPCPRCKIAIQVEFFNRFNIVLHVILSLCFIRVTEARWLQQNALYKVRQYVLLAVWQVDYERGPIRPFLPG